jgi:phosphinothricin acetyltransferase
MEITIRDAVIDDLAAINDIYNAHIVGSHVSFDTQPWDMATRSGWWSRYGSGGRYQVLVAQADGAVVGVAFSGPYRPKAAYDTSVETTVALAPAFVGRGVGRQLFAALLARLQAAGVHRAYSVVALPNDASVALHHRLGYRTVGVQDEVGFKLGRYWSTMLLEKRFDD